MCVCVICIQFKANCIVSYDGMFLRIVKLFVLQGGSNMWIPHMGSTFMWEEDVVHNPIDDGKLAVLCFMLLVSTTSVLEMCFKFLFN